MSMLNNSAVGDPAKFESSSSTPTDETDLALRFYVSELSDEKVTQYRQAWSQQELMDWCGDFRSDGALMLVCCERDVEVEDFRDVLEEYIAYRGLPLR
ncbi:MAG: hypothetical protein ACRBBN_10045 [Methyloligellaceae bacterium]